jgi:hypothetical protein
VSGAPPSLDARALESAAEFYRAQGLSQPPQLIKALADLRQLPLPLPDAGHKASTCVLLIGSDANQLLMRRNLFDEWHIATVCSGSPMDGLGLLSVQVFRLVIVDYDPKTDEQINALHELQRFNLQIPVINVRAWFPNFYAYPNRLNRELVRAATQLFGLLGPRKLPTRRPPGTATTGRLFHGTPTQHQADVDEDSSMRSPEKRSGSKL